MQSFGISIKMLQLPRIEDKQLHQLKFRFFKSLRIFLFVCQCNGAAPIHLCFTTLSPLSSTITKSQLYREYLMCCLHSMWCTLILCVIICATYFHYLATDSKSVMFLTRILYFAEYVSGALNSALIFVGCYHQRDRYRAFFERISQTYLRLAAFGETIDFLRIEQLIKRFLFGYLAFFVLAVITDFNYSQCNWENFLRSITVYLLPNTISVLALYEYFLLLDILAEFYAKIRNILRKYSGDCCTMNSMEVFEQELNYMGKCSKNRCPILNDGRRMLQLRFLYLELNQLNYDITTAFGWLVISTIISTFLILSIQFYTFYTIFEGFVNANTWLTIYTTLWVALHGGKTFLILLFNQFVCDEVNTTEVH